MLNKKKILVNIMLAISIAPVYADATRLPAKSAVIKYNSLTAAQKQVLLKEITTKNNSLVMTSTMKAYIVNTLLAKAKVYENNNVKPLLDGQKTLLSMGKEEPVNYLIGNDRTGSYAIQDKNGYSAVSATITDPKPNLVLSLDYSSGKENDTVASLDFNAIWGVANDNTYNGVYLVNKNLQAGSNSYTFVYSGGTSTNYTTLGYANKMSNGDWNITDAKNSTIAVLLVSNGNLQLNSASSSTADGVTTIKLGSEIGSVQEKNSDKEVTATIYENSNLMNQAFFDLVKHNYDQLTKEQQSNLYQELYADADSTSKTEFKKFSTLTPLEQVTALAYFGEQSKYHQSHMKDSIAAVEQYGLDQAAQLSLKRMSNQSAGNPAEEALYKMAIQNLVNNSITEQKFIKSAVNSFDGRLENLSNQEKAVGIIAKPIINGAKVKFKSLTPVQKQRIKVAIDNYYRSYEQLSNLQREQFLQKEKLSYQMWKDLFAHGNPLERSFYINALSSFIDNSSSVFEAAENKALGDIASKYTVSNVNDHAKHVYKLIQSLDPQDGNIIVYNSKKTGVELAQIEKYPNATILDVPTNWVTYGNSSYTTDDKFKADTGDIVIPVLAVVQLPSSDPTGGGYAIINGHGGMMILPKLGSSAELNPGGFSNDLYSYSDTRDGAEVEADVKEDNEADQFLGINQNSVFDPFFNPSYVSNGGIVSPQLASDALPFAMPSARPSENFGLLVGEAAPTVAASIAGGTAVGIVGMMGAGLATTAVTTVLTYANSLSNIDYDFHYLLPSADAMNAYENNPYQADQEYNSDQHIYKQYSGIHNLGGGLNDSNIDHDSLNYNNNLYRDVKDDYFQPQYANDPIVGQSYLTKLSKDVQDPTGAGQKPSKIDSNPYSIFFYGPWLGKNTYGSSFTVTNYGANDRRNANLSNANQLDIKFVDTVNNKYNANIQEAGIPTGISQSPTDNVYDVYMNNSNSVDSIIQPLKGQSVTVTMPRNINLKWNTGGTSYSKSFTKGSKFKFYSLYDLPSFTINSPSYTAQYDNNIYAYRNNADPAIIADVTPLGTFTYTPDATKTLIKLQDYLYQGGLPPIYASILLQGYGTDEPKRWPHGTAMLLKMAIGDALFLGPFKLIEKVGVADAFLKSLDDSSIGENASRDMWRRTFAAPTLRSITTRVATTAAYGTLRITNALFFDMLLPGYLAASFHYDLWSLAVMGMEDNDDEGSTAWDDIATKANRF